MTERAIDLTNRVLPHDHIRHGCSRSLALRVRLAFHKDSVLALAKIDDGAEVDGEPSVTIGIDDHELTLAEFGRMLLVFAGWGMRIAFVPEEYVHEHPEVDVG